MRTNQEILDLWNDQEACPDFKPILDELLENRPLITYQAAYAALSKVMMDMNKEFDYCHIFEKVCEELNLKKV